MFPSLELHREALHSEALHRKWCSFREGNKLMQKFWSKISAALSAFIFAAYMMFSPVTSSGFFRPVSGSPAMSATLIRAEEQPVTDESKGIAALLTLLFANGIRFVGEWENVSDGAVKMWNDFTTATGNSVTLAALGAGVAVAHGYMRTSATVNNAVSAFQSWYTGAFSVPTTGEVDITFPGDSNYVNFSCGLYFYRNNNPFYYYFSNVGRVVALNEGSNTYLYYVNDKPTNYANGVSGCPYSGNSYSLVSKYEVNGITYYLLQTAIRSIERLPDNIPLLTGVSHANAYATAISYTYGSNAGIADTSIEGQSYDLKDGYNLNTDQSLLLDIANLSALVASIGLTLDSINDLVQDWPAIFDTPWADTDVPDITFPVPIEDTPDNTIPWVNVPDAVSPDPVPDYVPDTPETEGEYKVLGLENVFPFSIPFDLYYLVNMLVAEPETPSFTFALYDPTTSSLVSQEVNLHQFDTFAALLRKLEIVLFIASLIFVTRGLIRS